MTIAGVLFVAYVCGLIFTPERLNSRGASFSWLEPRLASSAEKITINNASIDETITLVNKNNTWFVQRGANEFPAKQLRVSDFLDVLSRRASYPVRSGSASSHERLGLAESSASRITVLGPHGQVLLDLLAGYGDMMGQNIYLRKFGSNEVRSGEDRITAYLSSGILSWFNLRLIPETEDNKLDIDRVQRLTVHPPVSDDSLDSSPLIFTRKGKQWTSNKIDDADLDMDKVNSYIRGILYIEGSDFTNDISLSSDIFNASRIIIELGTGGAKTIYASSADAAGLCYATVSGAHFVYSMAGWMADRLFFPTSHFIKD